MYLGPISGPEIRVFGNGNGDNLLQNVILMLNVINLTLNDTVYG